MKKNTVKILSPEYYKKFQCIGGECEDTCCVGWKVTIDKNTYQKYRKLKKSEFSEKVNKNIKRTRTNSHEFNYAKIQLDNNQRCPFLNENKFCNVYINCGEEYLSHTCRTYPRVYNRVDDGIEIALSMSCPHAARLCLLNKEPMQFDMEEVDTQELKDARVSKIVKTYGNLPNTLNKTFWEVRMFVIEILQNKSYDIWKRLTIVGFFLDKSKESISENNEEETLKLIEKHRIYIEEGVYDEFLSGIEDKKDYQLNFMKEIVDSRYISGVSNEPYKRCYMDFLEGLSMTEDTTLEESLEIYIENKDKYFDKYMKEYDYIIENYLVNIVFTQLFPMNHKKAFEEYMMIALRYAYIKCILIGMCAKYKEEFNEDLILKMIQGFSREIDHSDAFLEDVKRFLKDNNMNTLAHIAVLVK